MDFRKPLVLACAALSLASAPALAQQNWQIASTAQTGSVQVNS